jgi:Ca-activated chloride channel family protein
MKTKRQPPIGFFYKLCTALFLTGVTLSAFCSGNARAAGLLKTQGSDSDVKILSHNVDVVLNNGFAQTVVDQVFINDTDRDLEALYTFPLPKQASLSELSLWVGETEMIGEVVEKDKATRIYNDQKAKGNRAGCLGSPSGRNELSPPMGYPS